jgi:hypothetical protein
MDCSKFKTGQIYNINSAGKGSFDPEKTAFRQRD